MRKYHPESTRDAREWVDRLAERPSVDEYRDLMLRLGEALAEMLAAGLFQGDRTVLATTNDDADFLARGVWEGLERRGRSPQSLACFWNGRERIDDWEYAPIVRRYVEPADGADVFIVVKSIVSTACVVRANVSALVQTLRPRRILVAAPVMFIDAPKSLEAEFDADTARLFEYFWIAQDDERRENGEVVPGVGGSVYELLGVGTAETKNDYRPEFVQRRRDALHAR